MRTGLRCWYTGLIFLKNGWLTHQSDGFLRSSKSHDLIIFMFILILSPLCDSLLPPHRAQELYTSWMTTVSRSNIRTPSYEHTVTNRKYLQDINDFAVCQVSVLYSVTDSWVLRQKLIKLMSALRGFHICLAASSRIFMCFSFILSVILS